MGMLYELDKTERAVMLPFETHDECVWMDFNNEVQTGEHQLHKGICSTCGAQAETTMEARNDA